MDEVRNVLLIVADQFRADALGCAGNPAIQTPNLDRLASEGVRFSHAFAQTNPCGPSRMCLYSGRYLSSTRVCTNETPFVDAHRNFGVSLRAVGIAPAVIGYQDYVPDPTTLPEGHPGRDFPNFHHVLPGWDWVLRHDDHGSPEYFDWLRGKGYPESLLTPERILHPDAPHPLPEGRLRLSYPAHYSREDSESRFMAEKAMEWVDAHDAEAWMLSLNFIKPHPPRTCPSPFHDMYTYTDFPPPNRDNRELASTHPFLRWMHREVHLTDESNLQQTRANYYGMVSEVDESIGLVLEHLRRSGALDKTFVIFTSDHGEYLGDHFLLEKGWFYDEAMRVPMIVRDPSRNADESRGAVYDGFVELVDVAPTIMQRLGAPSLEGIHGCSLLPCIHGGGADLGKSEALFELDFRNYPGAERWGEPDDCLLWVIRDDHFKLVQFASPQFPSLLFNLREDPGERENLADRQESVTILADYRERLLRRRMRAEDQRMVTWSEAALRRGVVGLEPDDRKPSSVYDPAS